MQDELSLGYYEVRERIILFIQFNCENVNRILFFLRGLVFTEHLINLSRHADINITMSNMVKKENILHLRTMRFLTAYFFFFMVNSIDAQDFYYVSRNFGIDLFQLDQCDTVGLINRTNINPSEEWALIPDGRFLRVNAAISGATSLPPDQWNLGSFTRLPDRNNPWPGTLFRNWYYAIAPTYYGDVFYGGSGLCVYNYVNGRLKYFGDDILIPNPVEGLAWYRDRLIGVRKSANDRMVIEVLKIDTNDVGNHQVLFSFDSTYTLNRFTRLAMTAHAPHCDSINLYIIAAIPYRQSRDRDTTIILDLDINNLTVTEVCRLPHLHIDGMGSFDSYKASRCVLSIDLDEDDSSIRGVDFLDTLICANDTMGLNDSDWWIYSDGVIDSVLITWEQGRLDGLDEKIIVPFSSPDFVITAINNGWKVSNRNGVDWIVVKQLIEGMKYVNGANFPTSGMREIKISVWDEGQTKSATARLFVPMTMYAGQDALVEVCRDGQRIGLYDLLGQRKSSQGSWNHGRDFLISGNDPSDAYTYVVDNGFI